MIIDDVVEEGSKLMLSTKVYDLRLQRQITEKALKNLEEHTSKKRKVVPVSTTSGTIRPKDSKARYYQM
ncbi:hypothetical protein BC941DRAFT_422488 [Chlamydoabsidia padenii]|nr:hypothetical protein BC941DRAFT_422488 [Chlamydoabsidia padenii]